MVGAVSGASVMSEPQPGGAERDLYRDTWVRYLGEHGVTGMVTHKVGGRPAGELIAGQARVARFLSQGLEEMREGLGSGFMGQRLAGLREG